MRPPLQARTLTTTNVFLPEVLRAGVIGTAALFVGDSIVASVGWPSVDYPTRLGTWLAGAPAPVGSPMWWAGLAWFAALGAGTLPLLWALVAPLSRGKSAIVHGLCFGAGLWLTVAALVAPHSGLGPFFSDTESPFGTALVAAVGLFGYGLALAGLTRTEGAEVLALEHTPRETTIDDVPFVHDQAA